MSLFEFVLTGFTLVLALVITRLLGALRWVLAQPRAYWVHAVHVCSLLLLTSLVWWGLWYQRDTEWTYVSFAYNLLIGPGIIYYLAVLLVPDTPRRVRNWRDYYYDIRKLLFGAFAGLTIAIFVGSVTITGTSLLHPSQLLTAVALAMSILGYVTARPWVHGLLAVMLVSLVVGAAVIAARSDSVLPSAV